MMAFVIALPIPKPSMGRLQRPRLLPIIAILCLFLLPACATPTRLAAVPNDQEADAVVDGMVGIRYWQRSDLPLLIQDASDGYKRQTLTIAGCAVSSLIQNQGVGDLYRIYAAAQRDGVDFNLAHSLDIQRPAQ